jgi:hypothetical protein
MGIISYFLKKSTKKLLLFPEAHRMQTQIPGQGNQFFGRKYAKQYDFDCPLELIMDNVAYLFDFNSCIECEIHSIAGNATQPHKAIESQAPETSLQNQQHIGYTP